MFGWMLKIWVWLLEALMLSLVTMDMYPYMGDMGEIYRQSGSVAACH